MGLAALEKAAKVVFVDQSPNALQAVRDHIATLSKADQKRTEVHAIPGELIELGEEKAADFIIAGVGVTTIASIIAALFPKDLGDHRLILSPQQDSLPLRWYLQERGLKLIQESVVKERGRFREILLVGKEGADVQELFLAEDDETAREYKTWLKDYRERIAREKAGHPKD